MILAWNSKNLNIFMIMTFQKLNFQDLNYSKVMLKFDFFRHYGVELLNLSESLDVGMEF